MIMKHALIVTGALLAAQAAAPVFEFERQEVATPSSEEVMQLPRTPHHAFKRGERLEYEVSYGWLDAGEAIIEVKEDRRKIGERSVMYVVATGRSKGTFDWFFKVRDRYETYMDEEGVFPWIFVRDIHEGGFELEQYYTFDRLGKKVKTDKGKEFEVPLGVQDMISSFYRARALDMRNVKPGDIFEMQAFVDNEVWPLKIKFLRFESIEIDKGEFDCMVFVPVVQKGRIFKEEEDMMVWVTNDDNKIPVMAKASVLVGSIKMELVDYEGLANPIAKL
jgi:hypothetical protein